MFLHVTVKSLQMPLTTQSTKSRNLVKLMENYPILSTSQHASQEFQAMNDELICDELVQKINDSCAQFDAQKCRVDDPMVQMTVDLQNQ